VQAPVGGIAAATCIAVHGDQARWRVWGAVHSDHPPIYSVGLALPKAVTARPLCLKGGRDSGADVDIVIGAVPVFSFMHTNCRVSRPWASFCLKFQEGHFAEPVCADVSSSCSSSPASVPQNAIVCCSCCICMCWATRAAIHHSAKQLWHSAVPSAEGPRAIVVQVPWRAVVSYFVTETIQKPAPFFSPPV
jgi:hypothetical protein